MLYIKISDNYNIHRATDNAVAVLLKGGIVAYPTETFYALGVKFDMPDSVKRLYELKKRPKDKAMPLIIGGDEFLSQIVSEAWLEDVPLPVELLMKRFWPGALTLLLPAKEGFTEGLIVQKGLVAVRIPGESFALHLAKRAEFPITATSANISGMPPAENKSAVMKYFGEDIEMLIDGGPTPPDSLPSTIVDASGREIKTVRDGAISRADINKCCLL